jgi:hypothetical protein
MDETPTLEKILLTIEIPVQIDLALSLIDDGLQIWKAFAQHEPNIYYYDGVGGKHSVDADLLQRTVDTIRTEILHPGSQTALLADLHDRFVYPSISLTNLDWAVPDEIDRIFCAAFNLIRIYALKDAPVEVHLNLAINQAADALMTAKIRSLDELQDIITVVRKNYKKSPAQRMEITTEKRGDAHQDKL